VSQLVALGLFVIDPKLGVVKGYQIGDALHRYLRLNPLFGRHGTEIRNAAVVPILLQVNGVAGQPEAAQTDGAGHVWVNLENKAQLLEFDAKELKVLNTWPLPGCEEPTGLASDLDHKRLFIVCHSQQMLVADYNGKVVASVPIGQGVDGSAFDPATGLAFASCGDGTITVVHEDSPDRYTVVQTISTQRGARTMALDTANHNVYTVTSEFGPAPAPTADNPRPRPVPIPSTFTLLIYGR
jgi:hypothetical protein